MFKMKVDLMDIPKRLEKGGKQAQFNLDEAVLKDSNYFIPKDEGYLEESGVRYTNPGDGEVIWQTPYARRLYYNPQYSFSTDTNPNAQGLWFEAAKSEFKSEWIEQAEKGLKDEFK